MSALKSFFAVEAALSLTVLAIATYTMPAMSMQSVLDTNPVPLVEQQAQGSQTAQDELKDVVITGTIVRSGAGFTLTDSNGNTYKLDAQEKAGRFEGKSVKVSGKLEASTNLLHIETIEQLA